MRKPGVLVIHNRYQQAGGEDAVVRAEVALLRQHGHPVMEMIRDNAEIGGYSAARRAALFFTATWNARAYREVRRVIRETRPTVAHCHNLVPLFSPAVYWACRDEGVPVVQTLHNFRLRCPAGTMFHSGEACAGCRFPLVSGCWRGCYRDSRLQTGAVALSLLSHRALGTFRDMASVYSAPSEFCASVVAGKYVPRNKVRVRPNFLPSDPGVRRGAGDYALFVGRLCEEKGVRQLLAAWKNVPQVPLVVVGDGPLRRDVEQAASGRVTYAGPLSPGETVARMKGARFLVYPSTGYETFGLAILEAAACGVATLGARSGAIPELIDDGRTGWLFDPQDEEELAAKVKWAWAHPAETQAWGAAARQWYLQRFTAERAYRDLASLYASVSQAWDEGVRSAVA